MLPFLKIICKNNEVDALYLKINYILFLKMLLKQIPENGLSHLSERLLLFRHDYKSTNILQLVNSASDVIDETLIEIVLTSSRKYFYNEISPRKCQCSFPRKPRGRML